MADRPTRPTLSFHGSEVSELEDDVVMLIKCDSCGELVRWIYVEYSDGTPDKWICTEARGEATHDCKGQDS